jgi:hypothetical protein
VPQNADQRGRWDGPRCDPLVVVVYVALKLADKVTDDALDSITDRGQANASEPAAPESREKRTAVIFGPDGELLREVELEDQD